MASECDPAVWVGWLGLDVPDLTSVAATTPIADGTTISLAGVLLPQRADGQSSADAQATVDVRAMSWATLTEGLVVPVRSPVRPAVDGLYRVVEAGETTDLMWPAMGNREDDEPNPEPQPRGVQVGLMKLAGKTVEATLSSYGDQYAVTAPVAFAHTWVRVGIPGVLTEGVPAGWTTDPTGAYPPDGPMQLFAHNKNKSLSITTAVESQGWLANSPRVEVFAGGVWWPCHGQPPEGYPVRVHNGMVGFEIGYPAQPVAANGPAVAARAPAFLRFAQSTGLLASSATLGTTDTSGFVGQLGQPSVQVVQADSEVLRLKWHHYRSDLFGAIQTEGRMWRLEIRRGMPGFVIQVSKTITATVEAAWVSDVDDGNGNTVGVRMVDNQYLIGQKVVSPSHSGATTTIPNFGQRIRYEVGASHRTRDYAYPELEVASRG